MGIESGYICYNRQEINEIFRKAIEERTGKCIKNIAVRFNVDEVGGSYYAAGKNRVFNVVITPDEDVNSVVLVFDGGLGKRRSIISELYSVVSRIWK